MKWFTDKGNFEPLAAIMDFSNRCYFISFIAASQEPERKKEKDVQIIDLTEDSETDSDGEESDQGEGDYDDAHTGSNTSR